MKSIKMSARTINDLLEGLPDVDHDDPENAIAKQELVPFLRRVMRRVLTVTEQFFLEDYFGIGGRKQPALTMEEIGRSRGMDRYAVSRIIHAALRKLGRALRMAEYADAV